MGGGLGLMTGCNYRIVNDSTILSMPEVNIGFYPDTGAAFFLGKIPKDIGLFIAITGCRLNGADAVYLGLADYFIDESFKDQFFSALKRTDWKTEDVHYKVLQLVSDLTHNSEGWAPYSKMRKYRDLISNITKQPSLEAILSAIESLETDDTWLLEIKEKTLSASPLSQIITYNFFHDCSKLSLREILHCEVELSTKLIWEGDFFEGVRALLIEKNRKPNWKYKSIKDINLKTYYNGITEQFTTWDMQPLAQEENPQS
jgi:enoyl-CoA hydratase/carnithine racemase